MKKAFIILLILWCRMPLQAEEGMWIPLLLEKLNISQMQEMGLKLSAGEIYDINHSSLKDAIVLFGGGCTAAIVSSEGLLLTNHHCGLGSIQRLSSVEHDYLRNGYWAGSMEEELPCPGLTVTLLVRIEDVTAKVLSAVNDRMTQGERTSAVRAQVDRLEKEAVKGTHYEAKIRPFFYGNQYYLFINEVFRDVRFAGAPPTAIGSFGGDTDNWMWPRHGGDFSVFRIYADKDNKPAAYSKENLPYRPKKYLPISLKGYQKGDFTFIFGYPGTTKEYLTSYGVELVANQENPVRIRLRQERLDVINNAMEQDPRVRIQYTSKHQGIANGWKKMIGETRGIKRLDAVSKKQDYEKEFQAWADSIAGLQAAAGNPLTGNVTVAGTILPAFARIYKEYLPVDMASVYLNEAGMAIELVRFAGNFAELVTISRKKDASGEAVGQVVDKLKKTTAAFFKDYQPFIDRQIATLMLEEMSRNMDKQYLPSIYSEIRKKYKDDFAAYTADLYSRSVFADSSKVTELLEHYKKGDYGKLRKDPAFLLNKSISETIQKDIVPEMARFGSLTDSLQRIYVAAGMEFQKGKRFYPDANSTIRISYGKVDDYAPADGVFYGYFTTTKGILEKENPDIYDYAVDPKLKALILSRDFGRYADKDGTMHVNFTASNHTTGGNSGSPVLDANGNLLGLNFDRNWEGTMSDLMYDPDQCRNITLDVRYLLFIMDRFAGASNLVGEMTIVD